MRAEIRFFLSGILLVSACSPQDAPHPAETSHLQAEVPPFQAEVPPFQAEIPPLQAATANEAQDASRRGSYLAASARGFPAIRGLDGQTLADGDFAQWAEDERLHVRIQYEFLDGRRVDERAAFRHTPGIEQDSWSWHETRNGETLRRFEVDLRTGSATGEKHERGEIERFSEEFDAEPGRMFAGFGFSFAIRDHRETLVGGEPIELEAVAFTPEPRVVTVELSYRGVERMQMAGRTLRGERFDIEPQIPWIAELFVDAPGSRIWLTHPPPAEFLRFEGPLLEPDDPVVRIDLLPGDTSGPAEPDPGSGR